MSRFNDDNRISGSPLLGSTTLAATGAHNPTADKPSEVTFESGAKRSEIKPAYDQLVPEFLELIAKRLSQGQLKYTRDNWKRGKGDKEWIRQLYSHLVAHMLDEWAGKTDDSDIQINGIGGFGNLGAIAWGAQALVWFKLHDRETYDAARRDDV